MNNFYKTLVILAAFALISQPAIAGRYYDATTGRFLTVDKLAHKYPSWSPYNYALDNPLVNIDIDGNEVFSIVVRSYIPNAYVFTPFPVPAVFLGDNRGPRPNAASYRTEQSAIIETDPNISANPLLSSSSAVGTTVGIFPSLEAPYTTVESGQSEPTFSLSVSRTDANSGNNAVINLSGSAGNPLVAAPASLKNIDYQFQLTITPTKDGRFTIGVSGSHDAFPSYEIYVTPQGGKATQVYQFNPKTGMFEFRRLREPNDDVKIDDKKEN